MGNKKLQVWLPLLFSIILIAGMYFGFRLRENTPSSKGFFKTDRRTAIQEIMDLVRMNYVDSVKMDSLQDDAIREMMSHLDPHSVYIPASNLDEVNEDITGNFEGIGIEFNFFSDTVNVLYVLPDGPSDKAGMQVGDKIIKVNNENITGNAMTSDDVKKKVRGERGSRVLLTFIRNNQLKEATVTRGTIPLPALDAAYLIDKTTGYIKLNKFSETAY
ncbi:MAG: PDZ domain-containing protein, partial [Chitinophagaceae bacterium]